MTAPKILIADSISQSGIDELARDGAFEVSTQTGLSESALVEIIPDFSAVVVRSQIQGQLVSINFKEGQTVKTGDLLAQIDPRPFQAALDMATATKAKDQAQLENAKLDLKRYQAAGTLANTQQQIDTQKTLVAQQQAQIAADDADFVGGRVVLRRRAVRAPRDGRRCRSLSSLRDKSKARR